MLKIMDHERKLLAKFYVQRLNEQMARDPDEGEGWTQHLFSIGLTGQRIFELMEVGDGR